MGISEDITERIEAEARLRKSLKEKEILVQEVHHRVKNNMQLISSLLNLQAERVGDPHFWALLEESQSRIRSMSLVHEKLYASGDLTRIGFSDYIRSLAVHLFQFNRAEPARIRLVLDLEDRSFDIQTAIPCGLILNELITNALKHAFPADRAGAVAVELRSLPGNTFLMVVRDDGIGIPTEVDVHKPASFGFQLVALLAGQLDGTVEIRRERGTALRISFKEYPDKLKN